jgi:hypothetical protein
LLTLNKNKIRNYVISDDAANEIEFMAALNKWGQDNILDDDCLRLWWDKSCELYDITSPFSREAALEALMHMNDESETIH